jgi:hypothetical protein
MANMSYCRFHNTLRSLQECDAAIKEAYEDFEPLDLSDDEQRAHDELFKLMLQMLEAHNWPVPLGR